MDLNIRTYIARTKARIIAKAVACTFHFDMLHGLVPEWVMRRVRPIVREVLSIPEACAAEPLEKRVRDEDHRCWWAWHPGMFEAMNDGGARKAIFPPRPGSDVFSSEEWTVLMTSPVDRPGEPPLRTPMSLRHVLALCGVEECRRAMIFAHQRAAVDAKRRVANLTGAVVDIAQARRTAERGLGDVRGVSAYLEKQLIDIGQFAPVGSSRIKDDASLRDGSGEVADLDARRRLRGLVGGTEGRRGAEAESVPPEHEGVGSYAGKAGGAHDREIAMVGRAGRWNVLDSRIRPLDEDDDLDIRWLPEPFSDRGEALAECRRQLAFARRNGGPSPDFEV